VSKKEDQAWAFSCSPVAVILVHLLLACEQQVSHIESILRTHLQIRFVVSHARDRKIQHFHLTEPFSLSRVGYY